MGNDTVKVVSLFSGCGGMDLGFKHAGFRVVWASDINKYACEVYSANVGEIACKDIRGVKAEDIPDCDVIIAGFPCAPFSSLNANPDNRGVFHKEGLLFLEALRIIEYKKTACVVMENVPRFKNTWHLNEKTYGDFLLNSMDALGYDVYCKKMLASDYGVPQRRERLIYVAIRKDLGVPSFVFPKEQEHNNLTLRYVLNIPANVPNQVYSDFCPSDIKKIPSKRCSLDEISSTITATMNLFSGKCVHPVENRKLNVRECARLQTFPDWFSFPDSGSIDDMYRVIGNAVPPLMARVIAEAIMEQVFIRK